MLGGFRASKCKTSCKLCVSRIKLLRNKRDLQITQQKREIAKLLSEGKYEYAWIRVEGTIRESNLLAAYEILELYLELVSVRSHLLEKQKTCPKDMTEAITTLMYAGPRVADLQELTDVRKILSNKFGRELGVEGGRNLNGDEPPAWKVNLRLRQYLSVEAPDAEEKLIVISSIATECNVEFNMDDYAQSVMVDIGPLIDQPPPQAPHPAMFEAQPSTMAPSFTPPPPPPLQQQMQTQTMLYPPPAYMQPPFQGNVPASVVAAPSFSNQEPTGDRPVLPPNQPSFRVPYQGPSTGGYTDAQIKIMGQAVQDLDEQNVTSEPPISPPAPSPTMVQKSDYELQEQYNTAPGPPEKSPVVDQEQEEDEEEELPSAPPIKGNDDEFPMTPDVYKRDSPGMDDDLSQRLRDLRKR